MKFLDLIFFWLNVGTERVSFVATVSIQSGGAKFLLKVLFPGMETLYINIPEIGPRLFIQHGFATNISAKKWGAIAGLTSRLQ